MLKMNSHYKSNLIKCHKKLESQKNKIIRNTNNIYFHSNHASPSSIKINKLFSKDKDKINLENIKLFSNYNKNLFNNKKKYLNIKNNSFNLKKYNNRNKANTHPFINILNKKELLFKNKLIRDKNKTQIAQINIIGYDIAANNLINKYVYSVIKDNRNNNFYDKNQILNVLRTQTKSNFNNKYKLCFKSPNTKKRNLVQNYFAFIKKDLKKDFGNMSSFTPRCYNNNIIYNTNKKNRIERMCKDSSKTYLSERKIISIPILIKSKNKNKIKEENGNKTKNDKNKNNINKNTKINVSNNLDNNEDFSFYSTKNPIFQTEIKIKKKRILYNSNYL